MNRIDQDLERRVWGRVYNRQEQPCRDPEAPIGQLYTTARDCAGLYAALARQTRGPLRQRCQLLERQMLQAVRRLAALYEDGGDIRQGPAMCARCGPRRRLELALLWMRQWTQRCREFSGSSRCGRELADLARLGENHCRLLETLLRERR